MKTITIKLTKAGVKTGPFTICDQYKNIIADDVTKETLKKGVSYNVDDSVKNVTIKSKGKCDSVVTKPVRDIPVSVYNFADFVTDFGACLWTHLKDHTIYNDYYGNIEPYIIEYPFSYQYKDEIVQSVETYDRVSRYYESIIGSRDKNNKVRLEDEWFNKAILYNGNQNSGLLELHKKPVNNMKEYMSFPKFMDDNKGIVWTLSDNMFQYNTFWDTIKDFKVPMFVMSKESLSIDKELNQTNIDYTNRAFRKAPLRSKDLRVRHILDNKNDIAIVSEFIITPSQISYK